MRRFLFAILLVLPAVPAGAQPRPRARLALVSQSPFASPQDPLRLSVEATNTGGRPIRRLGIRLGIDEPTRSRSEYRRALDSDPEVSFLVAPIPVDGILAPGETRTFTVERRLPELALRGESGLHPIKVQLVSDGVEVGSLRSVLVFIHERPLVPLNVSLTFVLDEGVAVRPDAAFRDDRLERTLAPGGRLEAVVGGLERAPIPVTLAVSPLLLDQLDRMTRGYRVLQANGTAREVSDRGLGARRAAAMLDRLTALARRAEVEVVTLPLASPSVPALAEARLVRDLEDHLERGRDLAAGLLPGATLTFTPFRPPRSLLTPRSVRVLARLGVRGLLVDPGTLEPPAQGPLTPTALAAVPAGRGRLLTAVTPDPRVMQMVLASPQDPQRHAQTIIGELSAIYLEQPSVDRGVAIILGRDSSPDPELMGRLLRQLRLSSPGASRLGWLRPVKASRMLAAAPGRLPRRSLAPSTPAELSPNFRAELSRAGDALGQLRSVAEETAPLVDRLTTQKLVAQAGDFLRREADGIAFLRAVRARVAAELGKVQPPVENSSVTLTSRQGVIPVTISSAAEYPVHLRVTLISPRLSFLEGASRRVVLDRPRQALTFPVLAQTTGRFPVRVIIATPQGGPIAESRIVVRSTAYNTRALLVTLAAALFLLFLWGRRLLSPTR